jgi:hypothetical protein
MSYRRDHHIHELRWTCRAGRSWSCVLRAADYATLADLSAAVAASAANAAASAASAAAAHRPPAQTAAAVSAAAADPTPRILRAGDQMAGPLDWKTAVTVASATTCDIGAGTSNLVTISGTTTITGLGDQGGGRHALGAVLGCADAHA